MGYHDVEKRSNINEGTVMNHSRKLWHLKRVTQLVLSVSVITFFFFHYQSSVLVPYKDYSVYLSNFSFKVPFACTAERNCVFLLCNGILALIIRASGLVSKIKPMSSSSLDRVVGKPENNDRSSVELLEKINHKVKIINGGDQTDQAVDEDKGNINDKAELAEISSEEDIKDNHVIQEKGCGDEDDEEEEELSADELHKKCEDFIKKVKRQISFENL